ncbi:hypothetical protein [Enterobacillus tribolii]|uniref:Uncharacterized protein n=1 Tax=Enterobacillus tribolii TaxID=1487935 RepID=A0A370R2X1_9GAMM|nr:hypothetical protein [Enterobacillus tribolii]MBW7984762.1 hypothetical protein [Enterobacillus tribolii]RDK96763.1 hypothetical protein C8D90_101199 [Enterobacillus tribolii]
MIRKTARSEQVKEVCSGQILLAAVINDPNRVYFLARKDLTSDEASSLHDYEIPGRVIAAAEGDGEFLRLGGLGVDDFNHPVLGISVVPKNQVIVIANDNDGTVLPIGGGQKTWPYESLQEGSLPGCKRIRCIDGYSWVAGNRRLVYKRTNMGVWKRISNGFGTGIEPYGEMNNPDCGFNDIDGFSEKDVYAAGGKGDIWKYDGKTWRQCAFPTDDNLYTVCCAKDGYVYVGARKALWKGKDDQWELVCTFKHPGAMNDLRWFDEKLWLAYDYKLIMWDGQKLHNDITHNGKKLPLSGAIDASDDMLLVACSYSAWTYDGKDWHNIIPEFN